MTNLKKRTKHKTIQNHLKKKSFLVFELRHLSRQNIGVKFCVCSQWICEHIHILALWCIRMSIFEETKRYGNSFFAFDSNESTGYKSPKYTTHDRIRSDIGAFTSPHFQTTPNSGVALNAIQHRPAMYTLLNPAQGAKRDRHTVEVTSVPAPIKKGSQFPKNSNLWIF